MTITTIRKKAIEEFNNALAEYTANCDVFNKCTIRHYGAALGLADLIGDSELAQSFIKSALGQHYKKINVEAE